VGERHDTVVVGGGQAGLAMSYVLAQRGREHVVLERGYVGARWRTERWDSLRFQFPNWSLQLPGYTYAGDHPNEFAHYTEIVDLIDRYAADNDAPVREQTEVIALDDGDSGGFELTTQDGSIAADRVILATGPFQRPRIPAISTDLPSSVWQTDPTVYRGPAGLPDGAVLVVGSGASGCQIADELNRSGRTVYLSVSRHRRVPRRFRGKDMYWWFDKLGRFDTTIDSFPSRAWPPSTVVTGVDGGYDVDVRNLAADGVVVVGRAISAADGWMRFDDRANEILDEADKAYADFVSLASAKTVDDLGEELAVEDGAAVDRHPPVAPVDSANLSGAAIRSVIWATGYSYNYRWVRVPVFDSRGRPVQSRGVTERPGLYFLGLHWMHTFRSGLLSGVGADAEYLAEHMARSTS
jgi:putative flavoprotein involved in K+ transport